MQIYKYPEREKWEEVCSRELQDEPSISDKVAEIVSRVRALGDVALREYTEKFDRVTREDLRYSSQEITVQAAKVSPELFAALEIAAKNIKIFHSQQLPKDYKVEISPGINCWRKAAPITDVGLYVPGGSAPLASTLLMLAIPATIAGCSRIAVTTPPQPDGFIAPITAAVVKILGLTEIYSIGGAQAIAALAYGTGSIKKVDKIYGPGNRYVTKAKQLVSATGTAIDMPAGPSELLIIADKSADPRFVAADLLSQAEHGADSQVILITDSEELIGKTLLALNTQLDLLPRKKIAALALNNSRAILVESLSQAVGLSNFYAPEHLILNIQDPSSWIERIVNAGSVFIGPYSPESAGDYASGTNHTLPTSGAAKSFSGVTTESFMKFISFQEITRKGLLDLGNTIQLIAKAEGLEAHANAVSIRLEEI